MTELRAVGLVDVIENTGYNTRPNKNRPRSTEALRPGGRLATTVLSRI